MKPSAAVRSDRSARGIAGALGLGFLGFVSLFYAPQHWLFFRYLAYFAVAGVCLGSSGLLGHFVVTRALGLRLPRHEHVVQALAVGVFGFTLGWFALGLVRCWTPLAALLWPLVCGAPGLLELRRARPSWRRWLKAHGPLRLSGWGLVVGALALLGLVLVYLPLIHPGNRDWPIFGSLFTFSLPFALLLRPTRRYWLLYGSVLLAVAYWYWSYHFDRYLQVLVPWMAAIVAVTAASLWRLGTGGRTAVLALGGVQLVWGADVPFFPTHALVGTSPHHTSISFLSSGFTGTADRFRVFGDYTDLRRALPVGARVLLHDNHLRLGLGTAVVSDAATRQLGIEYALDPSPRGVFERLHELGVSHLVWEPGKSRGWDSLAGDIGFHRFAARFGVGARDIGRFMLAAMPVEPPPRTAQPELELEHVLMLTCATTYARGLYPLRALSVQPLDERRPARDYPAPEQAAPDEAVLALAARASVLIRSPGCYRGPMPTGFSLAFLRGSEAVFLRDAPP